MIGNSDDETNFPHKLLLTDRQVARLPKAFVNNSHASAKLSKTHISNIIQFGGFFRRILEPLKVRLPLMKNIIKPLTKSVLIPLGLTVAVSAIDSPISKKIHGFQTTALIILNEEMKDFLKIVKGLEESGFIVNSANETI